MTWVATGWLLSTKASVSQHSLCKLRRSASSSPKPNWQSWSVAPCHNGCGRTRQSSPASSRLNMSFPPWYYLESDGTHVNQQQLCHTGLSFLLECLAIWQLVGNEKVAKSRGSRRKSVAIWHLHRVSPINSLGMCRGCFQLITSSCQSHGQVDREENMMFLSSNRIFFLNQCVVQQFHFSYPMHHTARVDVRC